MIERLSSIWRMEWVLIKVVWNSSMSKIVGIMQEEIIDIRKSEEKIEGVVMSSTNLGH